MLKYVHSFCSRKEDMLAPDTDRDFSELLKGTQRKGDATSLPSSPWTHGARYIGPCLIALIGCMVVAFAGLIVIDGPHMAEANYIGTSWGNYWATVAVLCLTPFIFVWGHARVTIGMTVNLQRKFACTYRDARYITERASLRGIAATVKDPQNFQKLVADSRYLDGLREFLPLVDLQLKELKPYQNKYANALRDFLERQRADILARV